MIEAMLALCFGGRVLFVVVLVDLGFWLVSYREEPNTGKKELIQDIALMQCTFNMNDMSY